ncbi:amidase family protein [Pseudomonas sp. GX19020]|jgi:amidase|uniref:amidase n=1 Tax=Pseudomonas sp. GX19020 TaxID=2942277 RepID=UPI002018E33D|nr:amidase family protein [Pseudomonas sp. GX19020]MCL4068899.1 amidase family protein [Pseudomonas sp. GX19020]
MSDTPLSYLSASELAALYRARKISPVEVVTDALSRIGDSAESLNAVCFTYPDEAIGAAKKSEARYMSGAQNAGILDGIPTALKDENMMAGKVTTYGSLLYAGHVATRSAPVVQRLMDAGAVIHARTTTPEFSCAPFCHSRQWGVTRNPWNQDYTPGGSSGGAGAALAAGLTQLATGSDIGGSIRIPASASGVVGFKPPYGRVPSTPPFNLDHYNHPGPMARSVEDCLMMQNVLAGPHPEDITSLKPKLELRADRSGVKGWKIAYSLDFGFMEIDPVVRANTLAALEVFRALGAEVTEVALPWSWEVYHAAATHHKTLFGAWLAEYLDERETQLTSYARSFARDALGTTTRDYLASLNVEGRIWSHFGPMMEGFDLFVCPTLAIPAAPAEFDFSNPLVINGKEIDPYLGWTMAWPFNMLSRCPVLSVPSGHAPNGVPTGIQLVGRTYEDQSVFTAGLAYEAALGGWYRSASSRPALPF